MYPEYGILIELYLANLIVRQQPEKGLQSKTECMAASTSVFLLFMLAIPEASMYV
jgi:hypothetical protein